MTSARLWSLFAVLCLAPAANAFRVTPAQRVGEYAAAGWLASLHPHPRRSPFSFGPPLTMVTFPLPPSIRRGVLSPATAHCS